MPNEYSLAVITMWDRHLGVTDLQIEVRQVDTNVKWK